MRIYNPIKKVASMLLVAFVPFPAMCADEEPTIIVGNSTNHTVFYQSVSSASVGVALQYGTETMKAYQGCYITELHADFSGPTERDGVKVFIASSIGGERLYEQSYTVESAGWKTIVLDTPFFITGDELVIGYQGEGLRYLRYSPPLVNKKEWVMRTEEGWQPYNDIYRASFYAVVSGNNIPSNNVALENTTLPAYTSPGKEYTFSGSFANLGTEKVTSLTVAGMSDGNEVFSKVIDGLNVASRKAGTFSFAAVPSTSVGTNPFSIVVKEVNGGTDKDMSDNTSRQSSLMCLKTYVPRKVLAETFSTEKCTNCPSMHQLFEDAVGSRDDMVEVSHHAGFYTDDFTIDASTEYEWFYNPDRLYAPAVMFDRTCMSDNYPDVYTDMVPVVSMGSSTQLVTLCDEASSVPAFATVDITSEYDETTRTLNLDISGERLIPEVDIANPRLYVMLTEDSLATTTQAGASGTFWHRNSIKAMLSDIWGDAINIDAGYQKEYSFSIPVGWNEKKVKAVAFVANYNGEDKNDCNVLNTNAVCIYKGESDAIQSIKDNSSVELQGTTLSLPSKASELKVFSLSGSLILRLSCSPNQKVSLSSLPQGTYVVKVNAGNNVSIIKVHI